MPATALTALGGTIQFAGDAPGEVAGVVQINVQIPTGIQPGASVPVTVTLGGATSPSGVTIAVSN